MAELDGSARAQLVEVLAEAKRRGFLGPGPVEPHIEHAYNFVCSDIAPPRRGLDIGSGGGVPGLALALMWPQSRWGLLDSMVKRCAFLREAVGELGLVGRVDVLEGRAEDWARHADHRSQYDVVSSRSFGPPAATAECAAGFIQLGGHLIVSEPPSGGNRWPVEGLSKLGLVRTAAADGSVAVFRVERLCPGVYPRRTGLPTKRPLF